MTLVFIQYPAVIAAFALCALALVLAALLKENSHWASLAAGVFAAAGVLLAFVFSVPVTEILALVLILLLLSFCLMPKEGEK